MQSFRVLLLVFLLLPASLVAQGVSVNELVEEWTRSLESPGFVASHAGLLWNYLRRPSGSTEADSTFWALTGIVRDTGLKYGTRAEAASMIALSEGYSPGYRSRGVRQLLMDFTGDRIFVILASGVAVGGSPELKTEVSRRIRGAIANRRVVEEIDILLLLDALTLTGADGLEALRGLVEGGEVPEGRARETAERALLRISGTRPTPSSSSANVEVL